MSEVNMLVWIVLLLFFADALCHEDFDACLNSPCQNGGVCIRNKGDYTCQCSTSSQNGRLYGGPNCTDVLQGCEGHPCQNGGTCSPFLSSSQQRYSCTCPEGYTGTMCEISTTFSFEKSGFLHIKTALEDTVALLNATLSFRTVQKAATLLRCEVNDYVLTLQLRNGRLRHSVQLGNNTQSDLLDLFQDVADGRWHTVQVFLYGGVLGLDLQDSLCTVKTCHKEALVEMDLGSGSGQDSFSPTQRVCIGGTGDGRVDLGSHFLGCMRDVYIQSNLVVPELEVRTAEQSSVTLGCRETDGCEENPCKNRGKCVGLGWKKHKCECHRPYEGSICSEEHVAARFGNEDMESYAIFYIDDDPTDTFTASMFVRTRRLSGLLLVFSNSTSHYLRVWLDDGKLKVQANHFEILQGHDRVNDGHFHLVSVHMERGILRLSHSARTQASAAIRGLTIRTGDLVHVGGLEGQEATLAFSGYFKGCIQDLQLNFNRLQFYPISTPLASYRLKTMVKVMQGCTGDNYCRINPCVNGGVCYSMWDDFTCSCPPNTAGRRCEDLKWCELSPCPITSGCLTQAQGFDCLTNITLREGNRVVAFRGNGRIRRHLRGMSLTFRTRRRDATLLHASRGSDFITLFLNDGRLVLELQSGSDVLLRVQSRRVVVSDGRWHSAILSMNNRSALTSQWSMVLDERRDQVSISSTSSGDLDFLKKDTDIFLGGWDFRDSRANLDGCLGPVEIGGLVLPFYAEAELRMPRPQEERFLRTSGMPSLGCWSSDICDPNPCRNGGLCEDLFDLFKCRCPGDWHGQICDVRIDACSSNPCLHGSCVVVSEDYECVCEPGYVGQRCENKKDVCVGHKCRNGGTCLRGIRQYACLCPKNTTGALCQDRMPEMPWFIDHLPSPRLLVSICGNDKWTYSCFNGGNCSKFDKCNCLPGFTGQWCELELDECTSSPCLNGGYCRNLVNKFQCVCEISFVGERCQIDISDFYLYGFLLMWQNIFQLLSYLILHMDDEPEVEWNAANEE